MVEPERSLNRQQLITMANELISKGHIIWVKWTCPRCGDRVTSSTPNTIFASYLHTDEKCGFLYKGDEFGLMVALQTSMPGERNARLN